MLLRVIKNLPPFPKSLSRACRGRDTGEFRNTNATLKHRCTITTVFSLLLVSLIGCNSIEAPSEPELQADFTPDALLRFIERDPNASSELIGQTLTLSGAVWRVHFDFSPPFFTLRSNADIRIFLLDESFETYSKLTSRDTDVIVEGVIESIEPPNIIIFTSAKLLN